MVSTPGGGGGSPNAPLPGLGGPPVIVSGNQQLAGVVAQAGGAVAPQGRGDSSLVQKWATWFDRRRAPGFLGLGGQTRPDGAGWDAGNVGGSGWDNNNLRRGMLERAVREQNESKDADRQRLQEYANRVVGGTAAPDEVAEAWAWALEQMRAAEDMGLDPHDPWYWLDQRAGEVEEKRAEEAPGPRTVTSTQKTYNLTDPESARALIRQAAQDYMGKRMSDEDMARFVSALNATEQANPTVTTTTTDYDETGAQTSSTSTTTGGAPSPSAEADNFLDEGFNSERDIYWAGTSGFEVAQALAGGIV